MKKIIALAVLMAFAVLISPVFAEETTQAGNADVGNKLCPVSGDPVSGTSFVVYQGKRYGLCCPACEKMFLANPGKYIVKLNAEKVATTVPPVAPVDSASEEMERDMEQGDL